MNPDAAAPANLSFHAQYDKLGNICRKYQFGLFAQYGYAGRAGCGYAGNPGSGSSSATLSAHQTQSLFIPGLITIANQHDARGNMTSADSLRFYEYNALNQATEVRRVASVGSSDITIRARFAYGVDGARYRRIDDGSSAGGTTTTTIIGAVERLQKPGGAIQWRRMIGSTAIVSYSGDQVIGGITQAAGAGTVRHQFSDRLGSVQVIGSISGSGITVHERLDPGADGQWRTPDPPFGQAGSSHTPRGFTGHEHLEGHDTIHMNGRLYWPTGGRMVQADPIITEIYNPQNWNPYSYVLNNPLNLTDPSGYSFLGKYWRTIAAIVVTVYTGGAAAGAATSWAAAGWSIGGGFVAGAIQTNSLRGGIYGAFSAGVFSGIGTAFGKMANSGAYSATALRVGKVVAHGMAGGVMSSLQGGKFGHGFASAGVTQTFSPGIDRIDAGNMGFSAQRTLAAATLGGTVSAMTGGKFANGAVTAAFSRAFNDEVHGAERRAAQRRLAAANFRLLMSGGMRPFASADEAAMFWHESIGTLPESVEFGSLIFRLGKNYYLGEVVSSFNTSEVDVFGLSSTGSMSGASIAGFIHNHPGGGVFSGQGAFIRSSYSGSDVFFESGRSGDLSIAWNQNLDYIYASQGAGLLGWSRSQMLSLFNGSAPYHGRYYLRDGSYCVTAACQK